MMSLSKFVEGESARTAWRKCFEHPVGMSMSDFNLECEGVFQKGGDIVLDESERRRTTVRVEPECAPRWNREVEVIYTIVRGGEVVKIGGTRNGMQKRWGSYLCGHCVPERRQRDGSPYPGKMSVTNAHLYHTIESELLENGVKWEFYMWELPRTCVEVEILGETVEVVAQTYHAYESRVMEKYRSLAGKIPVLCDNSDPSYR